MRLNGSSLCLAIVVGAELFASAARAKGAEPNPQAIFIGRNKSGSINRLSVSAPSAEDIAAIKSNSLAVEDLTLNEVDLGADPVFLDILHSPKLQYLILNNCALTDNDHVFDADIQTSLRSVILRDCRLTTAVLKQLSSVNCVSAISLQHAVYQSGALDYSVLSNTHASRLTIVDEVFQDCSWLPLCKNLEFLCVSDTGTDDKCVDGITGCKLLNRVECVATKITDAGLAKLRGAHLRTLMIGSQGVTSHGVSRCLDENSLERLIIERMDLKNFELWTIGANAKLQSLHLSRTTNTASALRTIPLTTHLQDIWLRHCLLDDRVVARIALFPELQEIDVSNSNITLDQLITIAGNPKITRITCFECELPADTKDRINDAVGRYITIQR
jgi:hypothetical protein